MALIVVGGHGKRLLAADIIERIEANDAEEPFAGSQSRFHVGQTFGHGLVLLAEFAALGEVQVKRVHQRFPLHVTQDQIELAAEGAELDHLHDDQDGENA